nr:substrate-binding domain-containing protein [Rhodococcus erythropolis]
MQQLSGAAGHHTERSGRGVQFGPVTSPHQAIYCVTDELAFAVLDAVARPGLSVPDDLSVVGFDKRWAMIDPPLFVANSVPARIVSSHSRAGHLMTCIVLGGHSGSQQIVDC